MYKGEEVYRCVVSCLTGSRICIHVRPRPPLRKSRRPPSAPRSAVERLRIVEEYASYPAGAPERRAVLRREGIYTSQIAKWRKLRTKGAVAALTSQPSGPKPAPRDPLQDEVERLHHENAHLQARLAQAETIIDVQKKLSCCLAPICHRRRRMGGDTPGYRGPGAHHWGWPGLPPAGRAAQSVLPNTPATVGTLTGSPGARSDGRPGFRAARTTGASTALAAGARCAGSGGHPRDAQFTIHADRGSAMTSKCVAQLLVDPRLAVTGAPQ
jgi:transposase